MIDAAEFQKVQAEICASGVPSSGNDLLGMEIDFCAYLGDPAYSGDDPSLWSDMAVRRSGATECLISGRARGRRDDSAAIAVELSRIWEESLRYGFRSAYTVISAPDSVALRAVTQIGPGDFWVTADIRVSLV